MTHIMVDLETWGLTPGSDIRSIGAVVFDPVAGTLGDEFYVNVENPVGRWRNGKFVRELATGTEDYRRYPLTRDPSTEKWWSDQSAEAQARLTTDMVDLALGLARFADWWEDVERRQSSEGIPAKFWANGPHFDEAILAACYRAAGLLVPWHYRAPRDCRTIWEAAGGVDLPFEGTEHDALCDAKHQARCVIEAYRKLREPEENVQKFRRLLNPVWMHLCYNAMAGEPARDDQYIFHFMGGGGSDMTTVAEFRALMGDERKALES